MGTLISETAGPIPVTAVPVSARGDSGAGTFLGGFTVTQFQPILAPGSGGVLGGLGVRPIEGPSPQTGGAGRGLPTLGLGGPPTTGPGAPGTPGGTSGIVAGFGQLAENLPRFNYAHIALFLILGLGLYLLWPRISKAAGRQIGKVRG
jgi:hypothetical protein